MVWLELRELNLALANQLGVTAVLLIGVIVPVR
jgi:hypothetical protein